MNLTKKNVINKFKVQIFNLQQSVEQHLKEIKSNIMPKQCQTLKKKYKIHKKESKILNIMIKA